MSERRREAADRQRREVFATPVLSCEELADPLRRALQLGEIRITWRNVLGIRTRAWLGMVEIVGRPSVGDAARTYEHHLNIAAELLIARDSNAAASFRDDVRPAGQN